jgi:hypothetical protein
LDLELELEEEGEERGDDRGEGGILGGYSHSSLFPFEDSPRFGFLHSK